jgi:hypothetical protein
MNAAYWFAVGFAAGMTAAAWVVLAFTLVGMRRRR